MVFVKGASSMKELKMDMCKRAELRRYPSVLSFLLVRGSVCCILVAPPAAAQTFTVHELTLGGSQCKVEAISDGRAVGWATTPGDAESMSSHGLRRAGWSISAPSAGRAPGKRGGRGPGGWVLLDQGECRGPRVQLDANRGDARPGDARRNTQRRLRRKWR